MKKSVNVSVSDVLGLSDARNDATYWVNKKRIDGIPFEKIFQCCQTIPIQIEDLDQHIYYCQIGDLKSDGEVLPTEINLDDIFDLTHDNAPIHKKMFNIKGDEASCADIMPVMPGDILIAKTRPLLNKVLLIEENDYLNNAKYYYTKAFLRIRVKDKDISPAVGYYIIKHMLNQEMVAISRIGKSGYPTITPNDLYNVVIDGDIDKFRDSDFNEKVNEMHMNGLKIKQQMKAQLSENDDRLKNSFN